MTLNEFIAAVKTAFPVGTVIDNPGSGTSKIVGYSGTDIFYVRGSSRIAVTFTDLHETYSAFRGKHVSSSDLRSFRPSVFDLAARPAGHSCNCTFLFCILKELNLSGPISGSGVRGDPYAVVVHSGNAV